jgi:G3E family GTPase
MSMAASPIPVVLLTGFLGAGKTSLLRHLLADPALSARRLAVVVNEFGTLGVDAALLPAGRFRTFEINKGSLFCICTKTDLISVFGTIARDLRPDAVLVEASGVAEPRDLGGILEIPSLAAAFRLAAAVCLVDPLTYPKVRHTLRAAQVQVRDADLLVLNKCDLAAPALLADLEADLRARNPRAPILRATHGRVPVDRILAAGMSSAVAWETRVIREPPAGVASVTYESRGTMDRARFEAQVVAWGERLLRLKGRVAVAGETLLVEVAAGRMTCAPAADLALASPMPTALVVITRGLDLDAVRAALAACELRSAGA